MPHARLTVWGDAECRRLHEATLELLAETGVDVRYEPALALFQAAGCQVDGRRVRVPARLVDEALASAPREWLVKPRGGETEPLVLRDGEVYFGTGSDVLYVCDLETRTSAAACAAPTSRAWRRSARSCPTSTSS